MASSNPGNPAAEGIPRGFRPGTEVSAEQLNRIADMLVRRITGANGVRVRAFTGGQIIIELDEGDPAPQAGGIGPHVHSGETDDTLELSFERTKVKRDAAPNEEGTFGVHYNAGRWYSNRALYG